MALSPKESGKLVAELAKDVKIKEEGIKKLGDEVRIIIGMLHRLNMYE